MSYKTDGVGVTAWNAPNYILSDQFIIVQH